MKIKNIVALFVAMLMLGIMCLSVSAQEKLDLRLRLEKGKEYKLRISQDMKINQTIPGQPQQMTMIQKTSTGMIYTVEDVQSDGSMVLKITYDSMVFKTESPMQGQNMEYDSTKPDNTDGPLTSIMGAIVGQSFTIVVTSEGKVKEIKGADEFLNRIQGEINTLSDAQTRATVEASLKSQYSAEALKANMENSFYMYPDKPVGIGDTWQRRTALNQAFPMIVNTIYTLKERKDGIAVIDIFAMIQTDKTAGPSEMGTMKMQYNMSGSVTGTMEIQESTGWTNRSNQNLRLNGSIMVQSPEMPQSMSIPMSMSGKITVEPY